MDTLAVDLGFPGHYPVFTAHNLSKPSLPVNKVVYRNIKKITCNDINLQCSNCWILFRPYYIWYAIVWAYEDIWHRELRKIADHLAPVKTRTITQRPEASWYDESTRVAKQKRRQAERRWRKSGLEVHRQMYWSVRDEAVAVIDQAKSNYYRKTIAESKGDKKKLFTILNGLLGWSKSQSLPPDHVPSELCAMFSDFFIEKIDNIKLSIQSAHFPDLPTHQPKVSCSLGSFKAVTCVEVSKVIASSPNKTCNLDPTPTSIIKMASQSISPVNTEIVNKSHTSGTFLECYKEAHIAPVLKKPSLDLCVLKNYRPVSNFGFVSNLLSRSCHPNLYHTLKTTISFNHVNLHIVKYIVLRLPWCVFTMMSSMPSGSRRWFF